MKRDQIATVKIPLGEGIKTDVDDKLLPAGKVLELENAWRGRTGEVVKRYGTNALANTLIAGSTIRSPLMLATLRGALVSLAVPGKSVPISVWSPSAGKWTSDSATSGGSLASERRGAIIPRRVALLPKGVAPDITYASGYYFVAYADTGLATLYKDIIDASSGAVVHRTSVAASVASGYRVGTVNGWFVVAYVVAGNIKFDYIAISGLGSYGSLPTGVAGGGASQMDFRVKDATTLQLCFKTGGGNASAFDFVPSTGTATQWTPQTSGGAAFACSLAMCWIQDFGASGKSGLAFCDGVAGLKVEWDFPASGGTRNAVSDYTIDAGATTNINGITAHTLSSLATGDIVVLYSNPITKLVKVGTRNGGGTANATMIRSVQLTSKTWTNAGEYFVVVEYPTASQFTRYVVRVPVTAVASTAPQANVAVQSGTTNLTFVISSVPSPTASTFAVGFSVISRLEQIDASFFFGADTNCAQIDTITHGTLPNTTIGPPKEAIDSLFVPNGVLEQFDGSTYAEAGFAYFPDAGAATPTTQAGGSMTPSATYWFRFVYRYDDANGRVWRSAPSSPLSVPLGAADHGVQWPIPTLRVVGRANVTIEVYRGAAGISDLYQRSGTIANSTTADTVTFTDTLSDASLVSGEFLYTNGGARQNDTIPGFYAIAIWNGRLVGVSADDTQAIWVSEQFVLGQGLRFASPNVIDVKDQHGDIRAVSVMDDKLIPWKDDAIYAIGGDGPNTIGQGSSFTPPMFVAVGVGCSNPQAIGESHVGSLFKSNSTKAGYFLLGRGLSVDFEVGADVQRYASETIVGTVLVPGLSQARMYTASGRTLVFDLVTGQWSTNTLQDADCATVWNGVAVYSNHTTLSVRVEDTSGATYTDGGNQFTWAVTTPWISMAGLRGYERILRVQGVGERAAAHTLTLQLFADYDSSAPFVSPTVTPGALWDWDYHYAKKLTSLKAKLSESSTGAGAKATALVIEYGLKRGVRPLQASKRAA